MSEFPNCEIKLCDLEVSRVIQENEEIREIIGTPDYVGKMMATSKQITCKIFFNLYYFQPLKFLRMNLLVSLLISGRLVFWPTFFLLVFLLSGGTRIKKHFGILHLLN